MKTRSWLALALTGGVALAGAAGTASFASTPPTTPSSVAGSAPASAETVQLSLLDNSIKGGKNEASATWLEDEVIPAFEAEMAAAGTPVEVSFEGRGVDDEDYKSQLALDLGAGEGPDVFAIDGIWVGEFATAEYIAPLTDVVGPEADDWDGWAQINDAVQANASFDGNRYGIPQGTDGRVIYFNKDLFEQAGLPTDWAPTTIDEVLDAARTIKEKLPDVTPIQLNGGVAMGEATTMQGALPLLAAAGGQVYDEESGTWTGATPEMIQMLGTFATIYGDEGLGDADLQLLQDGRDQSFEQFANGEIAMLLEGDYFWRSVIAPDVGNFPMANRDDAVGWARIPAYAAGGAARRPRLRVDVGWRCLGAQPEHRQSGDGVGVDDVHELGRPDQGPPRRQRPGDGSRRRQRRGAEQRPVAVVRRHRGAAGHPLPPRPCRVPAGVGGAAGGRRGGGHRHIPRGRRRGLPVRDRGHRRCRRGHRRDVLTVRRAARPSRATQRRD